MGHIGHPNPEPDPPIPPRVTLETPLGELYAKIALREGLLTVLLTVSLVGIVQCLRGGFRTPFHIAAFSNELADDIHFLSVKLCGVRDLQRRL